MFRKEELNRQSIHSLHSTKLNLKIFNQKNESEKTGIRLFSSIMKVDQVVTIPQIPQGILLLQPYPVKRQFLIQSP